MDKCTICNGEGWHYVGEGTMYECTPCNSTGFVQTYSKVLSKESSDQVQEELEKPVTPTLALIRLMRRFRLPKR